MTAALSKERLAEIRKLTTDKSGNAWWSDLSHGDGLNLVKELLDGIEALAAERDGWEMKAKAMIEAAQIQTARPSVVAERDRYREALKHIGYNSMSAFEDIEVARRALAADDTKETK